MCVYWHKFITSVFVILFVIFGTETSNFSIVCYCSNHQTTGLGTVKNKEDSMWKYNNKWDVFWFLLPGQISVGYTIWSTEVTHLIFVFVVQNCVYVCNVIFIWRPYYTCLCWFCYIDLTQLNFLIADMNCISYTIWRYFQNPPTYQMSYPTQTL